MKRKVFQQCHSPSHSSTTAVGL